MSEIVKKLYKSAEVDPETGQTVYTGPVADLVRDMEKAAKTVGCTLSRWHTNYNNWSCMITYAVHEGPRPRQFRQLDPSKVRSWTRFYTEEGTTERCTAYKKLAAMCEENWLEE